MVLLKIGFCMVLLKIGFGQLKHVTELFCELVIIPEKLRYINIMSTYKCNDIL